MVSARHVGPRWFSVLGFDIEPDMAWPHSSSTAAGKQGSSYNMGYGSQQPWGPRPIPAEDPYIRTGLAPSSAGTGLRGVWRD